MNAGLLYRSVEHLEEMSLTLLGHLGEPLQCWLPLDPDNPHYGYYRANPKWHLHGRPEFPSHKAITDARDHVLEKHPKLRFVGAHIGSLEYDVAEVARRFERYPNFAIDTSARTRDLACQDPAIVRQWFSDFPDRILFGTDIVNRTPPTSGLSDEDRSRRLDSVESRYRQEFSFYESKGPVRFRDNDVEGLGLPAEILDRFYSANARHWYPGI
jgi:predicted TIM-barrel fold metal-dependent hydrolase